MILKRLLFFLILLVVAMPAWSEQKPERKVIFHVHEKVYLKELGVTLPAKLDTGAQSASLSAKNIHVHDDDGDHYVTFDLAISESDRKKWDIDKDQMRDIKVPLAGYVRIKKRADSAKESSKSFSRREEVMLTVCIGNRAQKTVVNLTNREHFSYPLLVGTRALRALKAIVNPYEPNSMGEPNCSDSKKDAKKDDSQDDDSNDDNS